MIHHDHYLQILEWLEKKTGNFTSHDLQNEMLKVMALTVLREIAANIRGTEFYTVMVDECTNTSNQEQVSAICKDVSITTPIKSMHIVLNSVINTG